MIAIKGRRIDWLDYRVSPAEHDQHERYDDAEREQATVTAVAKPLDQAAAGLWQQRREQVQGAPEHDANNQ